jgi:hypothetical protein
MNRRAKDAMDPINGWVVITAHQLGSKMRGIVEQIVDAGYPVVVVDNGSTDETFDQAVLGGGSYCASITAIRKRLFSTASLSPRNRGAPHVYTYVLDGDESHQRRERSIPDTEPAPLFA